ncbi:MAG: GGDEF domain-containing protein, partial [Candidatus Nanopelagicales bacterium]
GGDEFLLVLRTPFEAGTSVALRVVDHVTSSPMSTSAGLVPVSLSAGAAPFDASLGLDPAIAGADRAMYKGRSRGVGTLGVDYSP